MNKNLTLKNSLLIFGIPLAIILCMIVIASSKLFELHINSLAIGITLDLLFTVPIIYFLLIRKKNIPKITVVPLFVLGIVITSFIIPKENQFLLNQIKTWFLPVVEIGVLSFVIFKVSKALQSYKANKNVSSDFFTVLKTTCEEIVPKKIALLLTMELAVLYYGFLYWKKRKLQKNEFSYHKNSGTIALLIALIPIIGIETYVLHILLIKWSIIAAWIVTGLSVYSGIQIFGFLKSILKRPIVIKGNKLYLRFGILSETTIDLDTIKSIEISSKSIQFDDNIRKLSPLGELENHNFLITLNKGNLLQGLYGTKKSFKTIAFYIDDKEKFKEVLKEKMNTNHP